MIKQNQPGPAGEKLAQQLRVIRHKHVCQKLQVSPAKLFDMIARGQFLKPFTLVQGGRAVGFLESDVDQWILKRKATSEQEAL